MVKSEDELNRLDARKRKNRELSSSQMQQCLIETAYSLLQPFGASNDQVLAQNAKTFVMILASLEPPQKLQLVKCERTATFPGKEWKAKIRADRNHPNLYFFEETEENEYTFYKPGPTLDQSSVSFQKSAKALAMKQEDSQRLETNDVDSTTNVTPNEAAQ
jgi:hypothetical protein